MFIEQPFEMSGILKITALTEQLRLNYDSDSYCSFTVASDSDLTITPAESGIINLNAHVGIGTPTASYPLHLSQTNTAAGGTAFVRVTGLQVDGTAMTGTLHGAYIDVSNGNTAATGTIRAMELKARTEAPGDTGNDVAVLEGLSISADSKGHSVTTVMRAAEFMIDGTTGGTIAEAVGLRIANNLQANKATTSYGLQIYRDSFDYTADIQLSNGGLIGGSSGDLVVTTGLATITKTALGTTPSGGLKLINTTAAADGAQQYSPPLVLQGEGRETDVGSSMPVAFRTFVRPIQGAAAPTGALDFQASINGGAYSNLMTLLSGGNLGLGGITDPLATLHLDGDIYLFEEAGDPSIQFGDDINNKIIIQWKSTDNYGKIQCVQGGGWAGNIALAPNAGYVGIGIEAGWAGKLHIDQASDSAAIPVLILDQADLSEGFINYIGTSAASAVGPISTWTGGAAIEGYYAVEINGVRKWTPYCADPTA